MRCMRCTRCSTLFVLYTLHALCALYTLHTSSRLVFRGCSATTLGCSTAVPGDWMARCQARPGHPTTWLLRSWLGDLHAIWPTCSLGEKQNKAVATATAQFSHVSSSKATSSNTTPCVAVAANGRVPAKAVAVAEPPESSSEWEHDLDLDAGCVKYLMSTWPAKAMEEGGASAEQMETLFRHHLPVDQAEECANEQIFHN